MENEKKWLDQSLSAQERAEALVGEMTVEEAAGQLIFNAPAIERLGIPEYNWWNEALHGLARSGIATVFPQSIALAATFDTDLICKVASVASTEARAKYNEYIKYGDRDIYKGLTLWSPNINIFRDPRWGRGQETFGEDPLLTAECGKAYVKGLQGDGKVLKTAACAKHMAVHSGPESLRHGFNAEVNAKDLAETYLYAFEQLVKDGVESVMGAYNRVNGEPSCAHSYFMKKLKEWGFDGYFVSDCWAVKDFHENHKVTANGIESTTLAIKSGCNVNCGCTYNNLLEAYRLGKVTEEEIKSNCICLMRTRIRLGMFDESTEYDGISYEKVACSEHKALALKAAEKSIVLLKNNGILPLDENKYKTIAVIGPTADSRNVLDGNYNGTADRYITLLSGIQDRFSGRVIYAEGCHLWKDRVSGLAKAGDRYAEAKAAAANSDLIVLCLGLDNTIEGEEGDASNEFSSGDKADLRLPESQRKLVSDMVSMGKPMIVVGACGSSINTECEPDALLQCWYPGEAGGKALAKILFGDVSPCGKLPVTFYETADKLPEFTDYSMKNRTYRNISDNVLFPFGYGLTYTKTEVSKLSCSDGVASVTVKNVGNVASDDILQIYVGSNDENAPLNPVLAGFGSVSLAAGEEKTVNIGLSADAFTVVDDNGERISAKGPFTVYAGTHQPDELSAKLAGTQCISITL